MMVEANRTFTRTMREELLSIIKQFNTQIIETDIAFETDRDMMIILRNKLIEAVDEINHLEYKELI